jgi:hypothetical protein
MELQPVFIQDVLAPIVEKVSAKLLSQLQAYDSAITGVHFKYGHPLEIINTLKGLEEGATTRFKKYPLIALFLDTTEKRGVDIGVYASYSLHMAIIRDCYKNDQVASERDETNFKPVLDPIYREFLRQVRLSGAFMIKSSEMIRHDKTNRYYWGRAGLFGNEGNIFNDWVDCIEIERLELKLKLNYCPQPAI